MIGFVDHTIPTLATLCTQTNASLLSAQKPPVSLVWQEPQLRHPLNRILLPAKAISVTSLSLYLLPQATMLVNVIIAMVMIVR